AQHDRQVGSSHDAITIDVHHTGTARAPCTEHLGQVAAPDLTVAIEVGRARWLGRQLHDEAPSLVACPRIVEPDAGTGLERIEARCVAKPARLAGIPWIPCKRRSAKPGPLGRSTVLPQPDPRPSVV
ncbi:MAG: hypothetical protein ACK55I_11870, partial [bacterium]